MKKRILIADDTNSWLYFHKDVISELYGELFDIVTANSAIEALSLIRHNIEDPFCLIITDLQMELDHEPMLAGEWLVENTRTIKEYTYTPIIIISAMYNIEKIAKKHNVECISKTLLVRNKLMMKFMFEKLMPFLRSL